MVDLKICIEIPSRMKTAKSNSLLLEEMVKRIWAEQTIKIEIWSAKFLEIKFKSKIKVKINFLPFLRAALTNFWRDFLNYLLY